MDTAEQFRSTVGDLIAKHPRTGLKERWEEAGQVRSIESADAYWTRDSDDVINIAWLSDGAIFDITWFPSQALSTLIVVRLSEVAGVEIRQAPSAAIAVGLQVSGDLLITINVNPRRASLLWVGREEDQKALRALAVAVMGAALPKRSN